jgi:hypothetical protein
VFIKSKKHSGRYYYRLNHSKREGPRMLQFSIYIGATLAISAQQWIDKLAAARGFHPRVRDVLPLVEAYVRKHSLPWSVMAGIQEAMRIESEQALPALRSLGTTPAHRVLGIRAGASIAQIKTAYRRLSKIHHPDMLGGDADRFRKLTEAYEALVPRVRQGLAPTLSADASPAEVKT